MYEDTGTTIWYILRRQQKIIDGPTLGNPATSSELIAGPYCLRVRVRVERLARVERVVEESEVEVEDSAFDDERFVPRKES